MGMQIDDLDAAFDEVRAALVREDHSILARFTRLSPPVVSWEPAPDRLPIQLLRDCLMHWHALREDRQIPDWSDFRTEDFRAAVTRATIVDPVPGSNDMRYKVIGSRLAEHIGPNWEGATIRDVTRARRSIGPLLAHVVYVMARERRTPVYTRHVQAPASGGLDDWHRLTLPFAAMEPGEIRFVSVVEIEGRLPASSGAGRPVPTWQPRTLRPASGGEPQFHK